MVMRTFKSFYKSLFADQIFIIKAGGRIITDEKARQNLLSNIQELTKDNIRVFLIYGGGRAIDAGIEATGRTSQKIDGRRITSIDDIGIVQSVMAGDLSFKIAQTMGKLGLHGIALNALPPTSVSLKRRPKKNDTVRYDGEISSLDVKQFRGLFTGTQFIACPSLGISNKGETYNINADNVAVKIASELKAAKLILLTDVDGVKIDDHYVSVLTTPEIERSISQGHVTGGMQVKMENCIDALKAGVKRIHILNGFTKDALRNEIYTTIGAGTMLVRRREKTLYERELNKQERKSA